MTAKILRIRRFGAYGHLVVEAPAVARAARPGQFVEVSVGHPKVFWRRPFSICRADKKNIELLAKNVGPGSGWLVDRKVGEALDLDGPLGQGFRLPGKNPVLLVGGGFGVAPLLFLAERLGRLNREVEVLIGGRCQEDLLLRKEMKLAGAKVACATEDGSLGAHGRVTLLLEMRLAHFKTMPVIAAAGPKPMLKAVASIAAARGLVAEVSLEEVMACGLGVCNGCVVRVAGEYKRVCKDGPVFPAESVEWN